MKLFLSAVLSLCLASTAAAQYPVYGTSHRIGNTTYSNYSDGSYSTNMRIGNFDYYNSSSGLTGSSYRIGSYRYSSFSDGSSVTSNRIGNFEYRTYTPPVYQFRSSYGR